MPLLTLPSSLKVGSFCWCLLLYGVVLNAQVNDATVDVIDVNQDYQQAYGSLLAQLPVTDGYLLLFEGYAGKPDALVHFDGTDFREVYTSPAGGSYAYLLSAGNRHFFSLTFDGGLREAYAVDTRNLRLMRVADEFALLDERANLDSSPPNAGEPLIWWGPDALYAAPAPYTEVMTLLTVPEGIGTVSRLHRRPDGNLLLFSDLRTLFTDGTPTGSTNTDRAFSTERLRLHDVAEDTYLVTGTSLEIMTETGELRLIDYPEANRPIFTSYVVADSLFLLLNSVSDTATLYRISGAASRATRVNLPQRLGVSRVSTYGLTLTNSRFFHPTLERDSVVLYSYDRSFGDRRREIAVEDDFSSGGDIYLSNWRAIGERTILEISIDGPGGTFPSGDDTYLYDEAATQKLRPLGNTAVNFSEVLYEYPDGESVLISLVERRTVNPDEYAYHFNLSTGALTPMLTLLNAQERTPEANGYYRWAGDLLYYIENGFRGVRATVVDPDRPQSAQFYERFGSNGRGDQLPSIMEFPGRFVNLGGLNGSRALYTLEHGAEEVDVVENIFGLTAGFREYGIRVYDDVMLGTAYFDNAPGIAIRNGGEQISYFNERNTVQFRSFVGATDSTLLFKDRDFPPELRAYNKDLTLNQVVRDADAGDDETYMSELVYHKGRLYFTKRTPISGPTQTFSLGYRTLANPDEEIILLAETFTTPFSSLPGTHIVSGGDRVYFSWPSQRNHFTRTIGYSDGTIAGTITRTSASPSDDNYYRIGSINASSSGAFIGQPRDWSGLPTVTRQLWLPANQDTSFVINPTQLGINSELRLAETPVRGENGYVMCLSPLGGGPSLFLYIDDRGDYFAREVGNGYVSFMRPYGANQFIYLVQDEVDGNSVARLYLRDTEGGEPTEITTLPTFGSTNAWLYGDQLIYREIQGRYLGFYDLARRVGGRVGVPSDVGDAPETFGSVAGGDNELYGMVKSERFGLEPFHLKIDKGRLIFGRLYADTDNDEQLDPTERRIEGYPVRLLGEENTALAITDSTGYYAFFVPDDKPYTVMATIPGCDGNMISPGTFSVATGTGSVERNLAFNSSGNELAAGVSLTTVRLRCREAVPAWIEVVNTGCSPLITSELRLSLPENANFLDADFTPTQTAAGTVVWSLPALEPLARFRIRVLLEMPDEMFTGNPVDLTTTVLHAGTDTLANSLERPILFCAYDPNDKSVAPHRNDPEGLHPIERQEELDYVIRFQNTGNDTAFTVRIEDQLTEGLDWKTFTLVGMSHPGVAAVDTSGKALFLFEHIMLPDSNINEPASHGFVRFRIQPHAEGPTMERLENTAAIFFDRNQPIITNTVHSTIVPFLDEDNDGFYYYEDCAPDNAAINPAATDVFNNGIDENCDGVDGTLAATTLRSLPINTFPVPFNNHLTISLPQGQSVTTQLYSSQGVLVLATAVRGEGVLNTSTLPAGAYLLRVIDLKGQSANTRWVIKH